MSVLKKKELEDSPLADLHAIASELGLEGFRSKRKDDLITAILDVSGPPSAGEDDEREPDEREPDEVPAEEALEAPPAELRTADEEDEEPGAEEEPEAEDETEEEPEEDEEPVGGILDILANGSGFIRVDPAGQSRDDVYISPAQIRRCELRSGDQVSGPVRPPRRNERHPSLIRVTSVNGADAEPPEDRAWFGDLTAVFPSSRIEGPAALGELPFGRGSRIAVGGPPGAGASRLLHELALALSQADDIEVQVVLVGVRPEEVGEWEATGLDVAGGSFERSIDAQTQAAELAVERAKRRVERGGHAAVVVDSLTALPATAQRRLFGAARATAEGGTLTVIAATGDAEEPLRWATTRIVLDPEGKPGPRSGTLRADALE
jgi:transcription termination factor Rho